MRRAFTLVELVVALLVAAILSAAVAGSLGQMARSRDASVSRAQAMQRAEQAVNAIASDLESACRDSDLRFAVVRVTSGGTVDRPRDELLLLRRSMRPVRGERGVNEGPVREVQYRLMEGFGGAGTLWRREDPFSDEVLDGGGVATPAADGVVSLTIEVSDGESWVERWESDSDGLPHGVRVVVRARSEDGRSLAWARRVVALDRVPVPPETAESEAPAGEEGGGASPGGGSGAGGTATGGGR